MIVSLQLHVILYYCILCQKDWFNRVLIFFKHLSCSVAIYDVLDKLGKNVSLCDTNNLDTICVFNMAVDQKS